MIPPGTVKHVNNEYFKRVSGQPVVWFFLGMSLAPSHAFYGRHSTEMHQKQRSCKRPVPTGGGWLAGPLCFGPIWPPPPKLVTQPVHISWVFGSRSGTISRYWATVLVNRREWLARWSHSPDGASVWGEGCWLPKETPDNVVWCFKQNAPRGRKGLQIVLFIFYEYLTLFCFVYFAIFWPLPAHRLSPLANHFLTAKSQTLVIPRIEVEGK